MTTYSFQLTVRGAFSAAMSMAHHPDKCQRIHGYTFHASATAGMPHPYQNNDDLDLLTFESQWQSLCAELDHHHLNTLPMFDTKHLTSERIAIWLFDTMADNMPKNSRLMFIDLEIGSQYAVRYQP